MADPARPVHQLDADASAWFDCAAALTVSAPGWPEDEITTATAAAEQLAAVARALLAQGLVTAAPCEAGCTTCDAVHGCDLVRDLAVALPGGRWIAGVADVAAYRSAVLRAGGAVFTCRRVLHTSGRCLFQRDEHLCGRVLAAAHHLA
jgi:hypothetical protein